jgi:SAM-dependent methyltransferase
MQATNPTNADQAKHWNSTGAEGWIELQAVIDRVFEPFTEVLVADLAAGAVNRLLDVGCGTGGTTLAAARRLGPEAECVGIDISAPMIEVARAHAQQTGISTTFVCGDAQAHSFVPASFDRVISRFGVMFFDEPVRAFANLRRATRESGKLRFIAWRSPAENPFMTTAERAVADLLPAMPARQPDAPGQFAFANRERLAGILEQGGWTAIDIRPLDIECRMAEKDLVRYFTKLGPLPRVLPDLDAQLREKVIETVRAAFDPYVHGDEVRFVAACWVARAEARAGSA